MNILEDPQKKKVQQQATEPVKQQQQQAQPRARMYQFARQDGTTGELDADEFDRDLDDIVLGNPGLTVRMKGTDGNEYDMPVERFARARKMGYKPWTFGTAADNDSVITDQKQPQQQVQQPQPQDTVPAPQQQDSTAQKPQAATQSVQQPQQQAQQQPSGDYQWAFSGRGNQMAYNTPEMILESQYQAAIARDPLGMEAVRLKQQRDRLREGKYFDQHLAGKATQAYVDAIADRLGGGERKAGGGRSMTVDTSEFISAARKLRLTPDPQTVIGKAMGEIDQESMAQFINEQILGNDPNINILPPQIDFSRLWGEEYMTEDRWKKIAGDRQAQRQAAAEELSRMFAAEYDSMATLIQDRMYNELVDANVPGNVTDFILSKASHDMMSNQIMGIITKWMGIDDPMGNQLLAEALDRAAKKYGAVASGVASALSMADPMVAGTFAVTGAAGSMVGRGLMGAAMNAGSRLGGSAFRYAAMTAPGRFITNTAAGMLAGGVNFGLFDASQLGLQQLGGGTNADGSPITFSDYLSTFAHGFKTGSLVGLTGQIFGRAAKKVAGSKAKTTAAKVAGAAGTAGVFTLMGDDEDTPLTEQFLKNFVMVQVMESMKVKTPNRYEEVLKEKEVKNGLDAIQSAQRELQAAGLMPDGASLSATSVLNLTRGWKRSVGKSYDLEGKGGTIQQDGNSQASDLTLYETIMRSDKVSYKTKNTLRFIIEGKGTLPRPAMSHSVTKDDAKGDYVVEIYDTDGKLADRVYLPDEESVKNYENNWLQPREQANAIDATILLAANPNTKIDISARRYMIANGATSAEVEALLQKAKDTPDQLTEGERKAIDWINADARRLALNEAEAKFDRRSSQYAGKVGANLVKLKERALREPFMLNDREKEILNGWQRELNQEFSLDPENGVVDFGLNAKDGYKEEAPAEPEQAQQPQQQPAQQQVSEGVQAGIDAYRNGDTRQGGEIRRGYEALVGRLSSSFPGIDDMTMEQVDDLIAANPDNADLSAFRAAKESYEAMMEQAMTDASAEAEARRAKVTALTHESAADEKGRRKVISATDMHTGKRVYIVKGDVSQADGVLFAVDENGEKIDHTLNISQIKDVKEAVLDDMLDVINEDFKAEFEATMYDATHEHPVKVGEFIRTRHDNPNERALVTEVRDDGTVIYTTDGKTMQSARREDLDLIQDMGDRWDAEQEAAQEAQAKAEQEAEQQRLQAEQDKINQEKVKDAEMMGVKVGETVGFKSGENPGRNVKVTAYDPASDMVTVENSQGKEEKYYIDDILDAMSQQAKADNDVAEALSKSDDGYTQRRFGMSSQEFGGFLDRMRGLYPDMSDGQLADMLESKMRKAEGEAENMTHQQTGDLLYRYHEEMDRLLQKGDLTEEDQRRLADLQIITRAYESKFGEEPGGIEAGEVREGTGTLQQLRNLFGKVNTVKADDALMDRVMAVADKLGVKVRFVSHEDIVKAAEAAGGDESDGVAVGYHKAGTVYLDASALNTKYLSNQTKATAMLHELMHSVTTYAMEAADRPELGIELSKEVRQAVLTIDDVFQRIKSDPRFFSEYGIESKYEMIAEISNPSFRQKLQEKGLWVTLKDAIKKIVGIAEGDAERSSAYKEVSDALDVLLDNYDPEAYRLWYEAKQNGGPEPESAPEQEPGSVQTSLPSGGKGPNPLDKSTVKEWRDMRRRYKDNKTITGILDDLEPHTLEEVVVTLFNRGFKIMGKDEDGIKGMQSHTGFGTNEQRRLAYYVRTRGQGGLSPEKFGERVLQAAREEFNIPFDENDANAGLNAVLSVLSEVSQENPIKGWIERNRIRDVEDYMNEELRRQDEYYLDKYGKTADEYHMEKYGMTAEEWQKKNGQSLFMFIGKRGKDRLDETERMYAQDILSTAQEMEQEGSDARKIKMATGFERGADGQWRYEVGDIEFRSSAFDTMWDENTTLGDVLQPGSEVLKAYPELGSMRVALDTSGDSMGRYSREDNTIYVNPTYYAEARRNYDELGTEEARQLLTAEEALLDNVINHEVQHWIQEREGFARGGSPRESAPEWLVEERRRNGIEDGADRLGVEGYDRLAGEVEARNTEARVGMQYGERRGSLATDTEDVSREEQIVLANAKQKIPGGAKVDLDIDEPVGDLGSFPDELSLSRRNRETIGRWLGKREDLDEKDKKAVLDYLEEQEDPKTQLAAGRWFAKGSVRLPEDMEKIQQAIQVADRAKVDPLQYDSPMELIDAHSDITIKEKPIDPNTVSTLHKAQELSDGIVIYDVDDSEESRQNMRRIINTHFGKEASPWCLLQGDGEGNLTEGSAYYWEHYNAYPKQVAFKDGKLVAFSANDYEDRVWWDRMDSPSGGIPIGPRPTANGRSRKAVLMPDGSIQFEGNEFTGNKTNGTYTEWNPDGQMIERSNWKDGRLDGLFEQWFDDGQIRYRQNYSDGIAEGKIESWYYNGRLQRSATYKNGKLDGTEEEFYVDGSLEGRTIWRNGDKVGLEESFYSNGQIRKRTPYVDGKEHGVSEIWFENGKLMSRCTYVNGVMGGAHELWYENGRMRSRFSVKHGMFDGVQEDWFGNGQMSSRRNYKDGKRDGLFEVWDYNGQIRSRGTFKQDKEDGIWETWDREGNIETRTEYKDGIQNGLSERYHGGVLAERSNWRNGILNGLVERYHSNGNLESRVTYDNWNEEGLAEYFYENGQVQARVEYNRGKKNGLYEEFYEDGTQKFAAVYKNGKREGEYKYYNHINGKLSLLTNYKNNKLDGVSKEWDLDGNLAAEVEFKEGKRVGGWADPESSLADARFKKIGRESEDLDDALKDAAKQDYGSGDTSMRQVAAALKQIDFKPGTENLDMGGGKYDDASQWLQANKGVTNYVYDPYNRDSDHNREIFDKVEAGGFDTTTSTNVLNVINTPGGRSNVILQCAKALKPGGTAYFSVYEGNKSGVGKISKIKGQDETAWCWQENRKTADYLDEVKKHFGYVQLKGKLIIARDPQTEGKVSMWNFDATGEAGAQFKKIKAAKDYATPEEFEKDYEEVGEPFKTLSKGSTVSRGGKIQGEEFPVGKIMAAEIYVHKDYANDHLKDMEEKARKYLPEGFEYNCLHWSPKNPNEIRFDEAPGFDSEREPMVGRYVGVDLETGKVRQGTSRAIWHGKWQWVGNDYKGFDVKEAYEWHRLWGGTLEETATGNSIDLWNDQLDRYGLPRDNASDQPLFKKVGAFYSNTAKTVEDLKMEKAPADQWITTIRNKGLKAEEDKWIGLTDWLKEKAARKEKVTKAEILDYVERNAVEVQDVNYSEFADSNEELADAFISEIAADAEAIYRANLEFLEDEWRLEGEDKDPNFDWESAEPPLSVIQEAERMTLEDLGEKYGMELVGNAEFYGGSFDFKSNYERDAFADEYQSQLREFFGYRDDRPNQIDELRLEYTTDGLDNKREIALVVPTIESYNASDEVHFGDAGEGRAIAWSRFGDAKDVDGNKVLVIDEIQSKRHQDAREKGYRDEALAEKIERFNDLERKLDSEGLSNEEYDELSRLRSEGIWMKSLYNTVPDAPFRSTWHELAMKRMLRLAAEEGYDKVAWTTGAQQADRYDIGGVVDKIRTYVNDDGSRHVMINLKQGNLFVCDVDENGKIVSTSGHTQGIIENGSSLNDVVGKEITQKILNGDGEVVQNEFVDDREVRELKGDGLRVGGEGMNGFYDQILPKFMDKYGKKWGVKTHDIELVGVEDGARIMHAVDVTDAMKESVMEGQPMFKKVGAPVFYSNAERTTSDIKMEKAPANQWLTTLQNRGLKAEEDKWMGLSEWLKGKGREKITKQDVLDYIRQNTIQIEEVNYSENAGKARSADERVLHDAWVRLESEWESLMEDVDFDEKKAMRKMRKKYGEAWDRALEEDGGDIFARTNSDGEYSDPEAMYHVLGIEMPKETDSHPIHGTRLRFSTRGLDDKREIALVVPGVERYDGELPEIHFNDQFTEGRAIAWSRFGTAQDTDGRKVLVIDEIQSQRHQDARDKGYKGDVEGAVPDAPFRSTWHELAMKRMLRLAAEEGYDAMAWTGGKQQAKRYHLGTVVDAIMSYKYRNSDNRHIIIKPKSNGNEFELDVDKDGKVVDSYGYTSQDLEGKRLTELVGKDIASKIMNGEGTDIELGKIEGAKEISGENLEFGSLGMKGFYDQILPKFMDKYGKKWGVKTHDIELVGVDDEARTMHSVDITDEMRRSVTEYGQPLFKKIGRDDDVNRIDELGREGEKLRRLGNTMGLDINVLDKVNSGRSNGMIIGNKVYIQKGNNKGLLWVASHETGHWLKQQAGRAYGTYKKAALAALADKGVDLEARIADLQRVYRDKTRDQLEDEIVNDAIADIFTKEGEMDAFIERTKNQPTIWGHMLETFKDLVNRLRGRNYSNAQKAYKALQVAFNEAADKASAWDPRFNDVILSEDGDPLASINEGLGDAQFNHRTWKEGGEAELKKWLAGLVKNGELSKTQSDAIFGQMVKFYNFLDMLRQDHLDFNEWSDQQVVLGTDGKPVFSVKIPNSEYKMNFDFSLVCKKRRALDKLLNELINRGLIDDLAMGDGETIVKINDIIRKHGLETSCGLCFVDAKRFRVGSVAKTFSEMYNEMIDALREGTRYEADYFNFGRNRKLEGIHPEHLLSEAPTEELNWKNVSALIKRWDQEAKQKDAEAAAKAAAEGKKVQETEAKETENVPRKILRYLKAHPEGRRYVTNGDYMASEGFRNLAVENPHLLKLYNAKKGTGGPKASQPDNPWFGEIRKKRNSFSLERAFAVGGVRLQSFSDFVPKMIGDYLEMFAEMAARKLPMHTYTKEELFVRIFGMTGNKINMSLVPDVVDGYPAGLDANGDYVMREGQTFPWELAMQYRNNPLYGGNVGTILVGVSREQILKAMADPRIDMIIPYHKSSINQVIAQMNHIDAFTDYTNVQNTRYADNGNTLTKEDRKKEKNFNEFLRKLNDPRAAAEAYVRWCEDARKHKGSAYLPKFDEFAYERDAEGNILKDEKGQNRVDPNYYKLLADFRLYGTDETGKEFYAKQKGIQFKFGKDVLDVIRQALDEHEATVKMQNDELEPVIDDVMKELGPQFKKIGNLTEQQVEAIEMITGMKGEDAVKHFDLNFKIDRDSWKSAEEKREKYINSKPFKKWFGDWKRDPENASKVVDEDGKPLIAYHGTDKFGFTVFNTQSDIEANNNIGSHFGGLDAAEDILKYRSRRNADTGIYAVYLDIKNPYEMTDVFGQDDAWPFYEAMMLADEIGTKKAAEIIDEIAAQYKDFEWLQEMYEAHKNGEDIVVEEHYLDPGIIGPQAMYSGIRRLLKEGGYDGIKYWNDLEGEGYSWIALEPDQIKSATDNIGTFEGIDIQLKRIASDAEYQDAVKNDKEKAKRMLVEAAKAAMPNTKVVDENGKPLEVYHGTKYYGFNTFYTGYGMSWFSTKEEYANKYSSLDWIDPDEAEESGMNSGVYNLYLDIKNPIQLGDIGEGTLGESFNAIAKQLSMSPQELREKCGFSNDQYDYIFDLTRTREFSELIRSKGFDGAVATEGGVTTFGAIDPNQIKSAELITRDNSGNVIPLSERFNEANNDIRFKKIGSMDSVQTELAEKGISINDKDVLEKYGLSAFTLEKHGDYVRLAKIIAAERGMGNGTRFMEDLASMADANGWILTLTPDTTFGASSVSRLKKFYKRFGFKDNKGRNTDFETMDSMIRRPVPSDRMDFKVIGNTDSKEFKDWFKKSKAVDPEGKPLEMYHGTKAEFDTFDREYIGSTGRFEGSGFNFSSDEYTASGYANGGTVKKVYLSLQNPLLDTRKTITKAKLRRLIQEVDSQTEDPSYAIAWMNGYMGRQDDPQWKKDADYRRALDEVVNSIYEYAESDADIYSNLSLAAGNDNALIEAVKRLGFDGVLWHNNWNGRIKTAVVFDPEQVKYSDNQTWTRTNPDMRFMKVGGFPQREEGETFEHYSGRIDEFEKWQDEVDQMYADVRGANRAKRRAEKRLEEMTRTKNYVIQEIKDQMKGNVDTVTRSELNRLLYNVQNAKPGNLAVTVRNVHETILRLKKRTNNQKIAALLSTKVQDVNGRNMSIAKTVSDSVRRVFEMMKKSYYDIENTGLEEQMTALRREKMLLEQNIRKMENTIRLGEPGTDADAINADIQEARRRIDDAKARLSALQQERDEIMQAKAEGSKIDVEDLLEALDAKEDRAAEGTGVWTQEDSERKAAYQILQKLNNNRKLDTYIDQALHRLWYLDHENTEIYQARRDATPEQREILKASYKRNKDEMAALQANINAALNEQVNTQDEAISMMDGLIKGGRDSLLNSVEEEHKRKNTLIKYSLRDAQEGGTDPADVQRLSRRGSEGTFKHWFTAPLASFEYMAQRINRRTFGKDGWFYKYFVTGKTGVIQANNYYLEGMRDAKERMEAKTRELFGLSWDDAAKKFSKVEAKSGVYVSDMRPGRPTTGRKYEKPMSKAQAAYVYMVWKMDDGRSKLINQGYDEDSMSEIRDFIGDRLADWCDWIQEDFLKVQREKYNDKYRQMYNTSMKAIEHYIPLKIEKSTIWQPVNTESGDINARQATNLDSKTGSLINRKVNLNPVDDSMSAFDVVLSHINEMEEWNAFTRVRRDMDYVLSNTTFRNQLNANAKGQFNELYQAAAIAMRAVGQKDGSMMSQVLGAITKGIVGGNIAYRINTALKQILSVPAFFGYSQDPRFMLALVRNIGSEYARNIPVLLSSMASAGYLGRRAIDAAGNRERTILSKNIVWCMENVPDFRDRIDRGTIGNPTLDMTTREKVDKLMNSYLQYGMVTNQLVDAITCSIGIKTIYDYKKARLNEALAVEWRQKEREFDRQRADRQEQIDRTLNEVLPTWKRYYDGEVAAGRMTQAEADEAYGKRLDEAEKMNASLIQMRQQFEKDREDAFKEADRMAIMEADLYYNGTQQSNHQAFMSQMQMSRDIFDRMLSAYQNASIGYARKLAGSVQDLNKSLHYRRIVDAYAEDYRKQGYDENTAMEKAKGTYWNQTLNNVTAALLYGIALNWLWDYGGRGLLGFFQEDDDDDEKTMGEKALDDLGYGVTLPMRGMPGMNLLSNFIQGNEMSPLMAYTELEQFKQKLDKAQQNFGLVSQEVAWMTFKKAARFGGVDLDVWTRYYLGVEGLIRNGLADSEDDLILDLMFFLNTPNSQRVKVAKKLYKNRPQEEYVRDILRASEYLRELDDPWVNWIPTDKVLSSRKGQEIYKEWLKENTEIDMEKLKRADKEAAKEISKMKRIDEVMDDFNNTKDQERRKELEKQARKLYKEENYDVLDFEANVEDIQATLSGDVVTGEQKDHYLAVKYASDIADELDVADIKKSLVQVEKTLKEMRKSDAGAMKIAEYRTDHAEQLRFLAQIRTKERQIRNLKKAMNGNRKHDLELLYKIQEIRGGIIKQAREGK